MKYYLLLLLAITGMPAHSFGQRGCGSFDYLSITREAYPTLKGRYGPSNTRSGNFPAYTEVRTEVTIPLIFHILYKNEEQNIPDSQILQQIAILNQDYSGQNQDAAKLPEVFRDRFAGDTKIRFRLQKIIRKKTKVEQFVCKLKKEKGQYIFSPQNESIKFSTGGGDDAEASQQTLNIWVGNITNLETDQLLGYASSQGAPFNYDGVVIYYKSFGTKNCIPHFDKGRTLTHEVGHWLGISHIWGDANCGDDFIDDTPPQAWHNAGCPSFAKVSQQCENGPNGDLFMNFMDYVYDECMYMFTRDQAKVMRAQFAPMGIRSAFVFGNDWNQQKFTSVIRANQLELKPFVEVIRELREGNAYTSAYVKWTSSEPAEFFYVKLRDLANDTSGQLLQTPKLEASLFNLKLGALYEIVIGARYRQDEQTYYSDPVLFVASGNYKLSPVALQ